MKKLKGTKGITLVALVVTIVVMLILAGISLNLILNDSGILKKSQEAGEKTKKSQVEEKITLAITSATLDGLGDVDINTLNSELTKIGYTGNPITSLPATIEIEGEHYTINGKGSVAKTNWYYNEDGKITNGTITFEIGEYVNYSQFVDETKEYTSLATENGWSDQKYKASKETTWRILGLNEANDLMLVSGSPIKKEMKEASKEASTQASTQEVIAWEKDPYLYMKGAYSYVNCVSTLKNICNIYSTSIANGRSMAIEDINTALGVVKEGNIVYSKTDRTKTNIDEGKYLGNSYTYKEGDYTPEGYLQDKAITAEEVKLNKKEEYNSYGYSWSNEKITASETLKNMLFAETTSDENYAKAYWLASPGSCTDGSVADFGPGAVADGFADCGYDFLFSSGGRWFCRGLAVRPVVTLKSNISQGDVAKLKQENQSIEEASWKEAGYTRQNITAGSGDKTTGKAGTTTGSEER